MAPQAEKAAIWKDLKTRSLSSIALGIFAFSFLWIGGVAFGCMIILASIIMIKEWEHLTEQQTDKLRLAGYAYVILPASCLLWMRSICIPGDVNLGFKLVLALVAVISATDIGAYFTGKKFGYNKLCPSISPNKTWEGLIGGVTFATIAGTFSAPYIAIDHAVVTAMFISPIIAVVAQLGDLFKSWMKRRAGVKDAGNIIPGHGGLLDRFDGYMFTAPILALFIFLALKESM